MSLHLGSADNAEVWGVKQMKLQPSYKSIAQSRPVRFLVGSSNETYYVHPALVWEHSPVLKKKVNGVSKTTGSTRVYLTDVEKDTFLNFVEYMYLGYYTPAEHTLVEEIETDHEDEGPDSEAGVTPSSTVAEIELPLEPEPEPEEPLFSFSSKRKTKKKTKHFGRSRLAEVFPLDEPEPEPLKSTEPIPEPVMPIPTKQERMWAAFQARQFDVVKSPAPPEVRPNLNPLEHYTPVFLSHAKLFVLAKGWHVERLPELALQGLHETLVKSTLYPERVADIAKLVEYCYSKACVEQDDHIKLRNLVVEYVAFNIAKLVDHPYFQASLEAENSVGVDLMKKLVEHLI